METQIQPLKINLKIILRELAYRVNFVQYPDPVDIKRLIPTQHWNQPHNSNIQFKWNHTKVRFQSGLRILGQSFNLFLG